MGHRTKHVSSYTYILLSRAFGAWGLALALAPTLAQATPVSVSWSCFHTSTATGAPSASESVTFELPDSADAAFTPSAWLARVRGWAELGVDFYPCLQNFEFNLRQAFKTHCALELSSRAGFTGDCTTLPERWLAPVRLGHAEAARTWEAAGAVPSFTLLSSSAGFETDLYRREEEKTRSMIRPPSCSLVPGPFAVSSEFVDGELPGFLEAAGAAGAPPYCQHQIANNYLRAIREYMPSGRTCANPIHADLCTRSRAAARRLLELLAPYATFAPWTDQSTLFRDVAACIVDQPGPAEIIDSLWRATIYATSCVQLNPGESRTANVTVPMNAGYRLRRRAADAPASTPDYTAELNLNFVVPPEAPVTAGSPTPQPIDPRGVVEQCLRSAGPYLRGPDGQQLGIRLVDGAGSDAPPPIDIRIGAAGMRANSREYPRELVETGVDAFRQAGNCETVTHEILHLLGLVDEYQEEMIGFVHDPATGEIVHVEDRGSSRHAGASAATSPTPDYLRAFNCRALGPPDSVMSDPHRAFGAVQGAYVTETCQCPMSGKEAVAGDRDRCEAAISTWADANACPPGAISYAARTPVEGAPSGYRESFESGTRGFVPPHSYVIRRIAPPARSSLLHPAHFRAITQPGCEGANQTYYQCAQRAYETSEGNFGSGCSRAENPACSTPGDAWLR